MSWSLGSFVLFVKQSSLKSVEMVGESIAISPVLVNTLNETNLVNDYSRYVFHFFLSLSRVNWVVWKVNEPRKSYSSLW